jgi:hypothetical protein
MKETKKIVTAADRQQAAILTPEHRSSISNYFFACIDIFAGSE